MLSNEEVLQQSQSAYRQWHELWSEHSRINGELYKRNGWTFKELLYRGIGKNLLSVALGPSIEKQIDIIKKYRNNVDIICVDKCFGKLVDNGIIPDYVIIADAMISYEKWIEPWIDKTKNTILISSVCANPKFAQNWKNKEVYFFVNKDNIQTEKIYGEISGCHDYIIASSNVGNAAVVFAAQALGYDDISLIGYDYCWADDENYYAFEDSDKRYWMNHGSSIDNFGKFVAISQNLLFSSKWMSDFQFGEAQPKGIRIWNCTPGGILNNYQRINLERKLRKCGKRQITQKEKSMVIESHLENLIINASEEASTMLNDALKKLNVSQVVIRHIPQQGAQWIASL